MRPLPNVSRLRRSLQYRLSPQYLYLDALRDAGRAALVLGTARSGTTKVAEMLTAEGRARLVFEPLHTHPTNFLVPEDFAWGAYRSPHEDDAELEAVWRSILTGAARSPWIDSKNSARLPTRRVVKCITSTNLAAWLRVLFPTTPIIYVTRHPFAVGVSIRDLGRRSPRKWVDNHLGTYLDAMIERSGLLEGPLDSVASEVRALASDDMPPFERAIVRWCLENWVALKQRPEGVTFVAYERLVSVPEDVAREIERACGVPLGRALERFGESSRTDFSVKELGRMGTPEDRAWGWRERISTDESVAGREILSAFGIDLQNSF